MTPAEWTKIVGIIAADWPHSPPPDESIEKWYADLSDLPGEQVLSAVESFYRDGEKFPPNGGQILARIAELDRGDPDQGEAWRIVEDALWHHNGEEFMPWLRAQSPAVAEAVRRFGFTCVEGTYSYLTEQAPTIRAQFRGVYQAVVGERKRDKSYAGLNPAGLRGLEPRKISEILPKVLGP